MRSNVFMIAANAADQEWFRLASVRALRPAYLHFYPDLASALDWLKSSRERVNLILLDADGLKTPELQSFLSAYRISRYRKIPLVMYGSSPDYPVRTYAEDVNAFLLAPSDPEERTRMWHSVVEFWLNVSHLPWEF